MVNKFFIVILILAISAGLYNFVIHPFKILGADVGSYKNGQVVFGISKSLVPWYQIKQGEIIVYKNNEPVSGDFDSIAYIEAAPGDLASTYTYYLSEEILGATVPTGYYVIKDKPFKIIKKSQVTHIIWFPFK